ncbi:hypothetical protein ESCO_003479 [Escovopsis weberi]|uniref:Uncharacterized protein n=1 Tax=Escovopsis weberi TaxID=150374 RepID=A0A0M8NA69_ESCWE|nr:hypothetical protein ESCO_003479 [Escovopsis weberi]
MNNDNDNDNDDDDDDDDDDDAPAPAVSAEGRTMGTSQPASPECVNDAGSDPPWTSAMPTSAES